MPRTSILLLAGLMSLAACGRDDTQEPAPAESLAPDVGATDPITGYPMPTGTSTMAPETAMPTPTGSPMETGTPTPTDPAT